MRRTDDECEAVEYKEKKGTEQHRKGIKKTDEIYTLCYKEYKL